jgi:hypothetical protein
MQVTDKLPIGAVALFEHGEKRCPMVIVYHSEGTGRDPETLYFAVEYRGDFIYQEWPDLPMHSLDFLIFSLESGWTVGNADRHLFKDTGKRVKVRPYEYKKPRS